MKMCGWLDVSPSGFYEWVNRPASATAQRRKRLAALVRAIFDESDGTYGYRRVHAALARQGDDCGLELVRDLMRELGLVPCQPRPWRPRTTHPGAGAEVVPDLVGSRFCRLGRASPIWPPSSTVPPKNASDTRSPMTCAPSWS